MSRHYLEAGAVAVVTGAASGIGLAACCAYAARGMSVAMADTDQNKMGKAVAKVEEAACGGQVLSRVLDVSDRVALEGFAADIVAAFGRVDLLMNNAAARIARSLTPDIETWHRAMEVNFWAAVHGQEVFLPHLVARDAPAAIVNTGSKQGITNPPGNLIYNITKSALKTYTEGLEHRLRNTEGCKVSAHLLVPGWTTTGDNEHKPGAWLPAQVIEQLIAALESGDFYIICPDNEVTSEMDAKRILWAAEDMTQNRPPLSRWHPAWRDKFSDD